MGFMDKIKNMFGGNKASNSMSSNTISTAQPMSSDNSASAMNDMPLSQSNESLGNPAVSTAQNLAVPIPATNMPSTPPVASPVNAQPQPAVTTTSQPVNPMPASNPVAAQPINPMPTPAVVANPAATPTPTNNPMQPQSNTVSQQPMPNQPLQPSPTNPNPQNPLR